VATRVVTRAIVHPKKQARSRPAHARTVRSRARRAPKPKPMAQPVQSEPIVHTTHIAPAPKTRSTPRQPTSTRPYLLSDNFETAAFDSRIWHRAFNGTGADLAQRNGRLEIGLGADSVGDSQYNIVEAHYGTNCLLVGDFDVRVEFRLLTWPAGNGARLTLAAWRASAMSATVSRFALAGAEGYAAEEPLPPVVGPGTNSIRRQTADDAGALRLRRRDDFLTIYYRRGGNWESFAGLPYLGNVLVALQLSATSEFSHQPVRVAFDNFSGEAEDVACPNGVAPPPRKPRS
jgi:hypothetical protein